MKKKGFTLAESVVALAVTSVVFLMAITAVLTITSTYKKTDNLRFFSNEVSNFWECYRLDGEKGFIKNANRHLGTKLEAIEDYSVKNMRYVYYKSDYVMTNNPEEASYTIFIELDNSFFAYVKNNAGDTVFTMQEQFYSHYDL